MNVREGEVLQPGIAESLLGDRVVRHPLVRRLLAIDAERRLVLMSLLVGALVFVPYVGAVGLWDPWESHYGEVAREMIARNDYVHPYWESSWFFSKPPLTMWMDVPGMALVGTNRTAGKLALYTEWAMRMPFVLLVLASLALLALALGRTVNHRVGLASTVVLATMPLFFLVTRQVVTDTPFVATLIARDGLRDHRPASTSGPGTAPAWWMAFYVFCGPVHAGQGAPRRGPAGGHPPALRAGLRLPLGRRRAARTHWRWMTSAAYRKDGRGGDGADARALRRRCPGCGCCTGIGVFLAVAGALVRRDVRLPRRGRRGEDASSTASSSTTT